MDAMELFFNYLDLEKSKLIKILDSYFDRNGIAIDECIAFAFAEEYEEYEEGYFGKEGLKIVIQEPIVDKEKEEVYSLIEFWEGINEYYNQNKKYYLEDKEIIEKKLKEVKEIIK